MQKIGKQIQIEKDKDSLKVEIFPNPGSKDKLILILWIIGWSLCGLAVIAQLLFYLDAYESKQIAFLLIYLSFWGYLEFKVLYAFSWNKRGKELIEIIDGKFSYTKLMGKRGLPFECEKNLLSKFAYEESTENGIWNDINRAAWMVAGEVIQYKTDDKLRRLGLKLPKKDAVKLAELLNKYLVKLPC
ncbi:MAG: hypothetical protein ACJA0Q_001484 [Saprospiraceae bacterium]|jgi:hypothetical protein